MTTTLADFKIEGPSGILRVVMERSMIPYHEAHQSYVVKFYFNDRKIVSPPMDSYEALINYSVRRFIEFIDDDWQF